MILSCYLVYINYTSCPLDWTCRECWCDYQWANGIHAFQRKNARELSPCKEMAETWRLIIFTFSPSYLVPREGLTLKLLARFTSNLNTLYYCWLQEKCSQQEETYTLLHSQMMRCTWNILANLTSGELFFIFFTFSVTVDIHSLSFVLCRCSFFAFFIIKPSHNYLTVFLLYLIYITICFLLIFPGVRILFMVLTWPACDKLPPKSTSSNLLL